MSGFAALLTPWDRGRVTDLGNQVWRKRVLPVDDITYEGRTLKFTPSYLKGLEAAYRDRAYDYVPFQLADDKNTHTNAPERYAGRIVDMKAEDDGLWIYLNPTADGEKILRTNPYLGVSARIVEQYARADGKFYPAAVQHVLGTHDPRITGLGGWQVVEAANTPSLVIDLTSASFSGEEPQMPDLTPQQQANLSRLLNMDPAQLDAVLGQAQPPGGQQYQPPVSPQSQYQSPVQPPAVPDDQLTDAELADLLDALGDDDLAALESDFYAQTGAGAMVSGLTNEAQMAIDLANARADENERQLGVFQGELDRQRFETERRQLADLGVPPYITDLARPLLQGSGHVVDLATPMQTADGRVVQRVDGGQVMRQVLGQYAKMAQMLDLSAEAGSPFDEPLDGGASQRGPYGLSQASADTFGRARQQMGLG